MYYTYNAYLRYCGIIDHPDNCPDNCECTPEAPPDTPWPDGHWPYFLENGWEMVEIHRH